MGRLIYGVLMSIDGYIADEHGKFDWAEPDEEEHRFVNEMARPAGTHLYGRRMYEVMSFWETAHAQPDAPDYIVDFARIWQAAEKVVYSRTLTAPSTERTRIEHEFDPEAVREMKASSGRDLLVGGAELTGAAIRAGLVDEYQIYLAPVLVGGGKRGLPDDAGQDLELVDERRFGNGVVHLRYRTRR